MFCKSDNCYGGYILKIYPRTDKTAYREVHEICPVCLGKFYTKEPITIIKAKKKKATEKFVIPF